MQFIFIDKCASFDDKKLRIMALFPFSAELRRMSSVVAFYKGEIFKDFRVLSKGAPETMETLYETVSKIDFDISNQ